MNGLVERERRLRNLRTAIGIGLDEEVKRNKSTLSKSLSVDFNREMTMAERCVYNDDFDGALYHGFVAEMIHRTLYDFELDYNLRHLKYDLALSSTFAFFSESLIPIISLNSIE